MARTRRLTIETLEDRRMLATFTVTNLNDAGTGSLRAAVTAANSNTSTADDIVFGAGLTGTITLTTLQLTIQGPVTITGPAGGAPAITISGNNAMRIFNIDRPGTTTENFDVTLANLALRNGYAVGDGGAIRSVTLGTMAIQNSTITGSVADSAFAYGIYGKGGGIYASGSTLNISDSRVAGNYAYVGGGITQVNGATTITRSTIEGNEASFTGGIDKFGSTLEITDSTISGNTSYSLAGGVSLNSGTGAIKNSTISGNLAAVYGGGVDVRNSSLTVTGSTITNNHADGVGGGLIRSGSTAALTLKNTIVAGNTSGPNGPDIGNSGFPAGALSVNYTIIGDTNGLTAGQLTQINSGAGNQLNVDPLLEALANNGGPTWTHALDEGSPARNAGDLADQIGQPGVPNFDQRGTGFSRVIGGRIDIGAYEDQSAVAPISADFDDSGHVNGLDFLLWQIGYNTTYGPEHLEAWEEQYGGPPPLAAVSGDDALLALWGNATGDRETASDEGEAWDESAPLEVIVDEVFAEVGAVAPQLPEGDIAVERSSGEGDDELALTVAEEAA